MNPVNNKVISTVPEEKKNRTNNILCIIPTGRYCLKFAAEAIVGVIATPFSAITCGKIKKLNDLADKTISAKYILPLIFNRVLSIINPNAKCTDIKQQAFYSRIIIQIDEKFTELKNSPSFAKREIASRLLIGAGIPVGVIARIADTIIAIPLVASSLLICGTEQKINELALIHLRAPLSIFYDVSISLRCFVNPHSRS